MTTLRWPARTPYCNGVSPLLHRVLEYGSNLVPNAIRMRKKVANNGNNSNDEDRKCLIVWCWGGSGDGDQLVVVGIDFLPAGDMTYLFFGFGVARPLARM